MRLRPVNSSGTSAPGASTGSMVMLSPSMSTPTPSDVRMSAVMPTSPTAGALVMVLGRVPSMAATMCLVTAFFDPLTWTSPTRGPLGRMCQASAVDASIGARLLVASRDSDEPERHVRCAHGASACVRRT